MVKFQSFSAEKLVTPQTPKAKYQINNTSKKESHFEMIKKLELSHKDHIELKEYCDNLNLDFLSTPYDISSANDRDLSNPNKWDEASPIFQKHRK